MRVPTPLRTAVYERYTHTMPATTIKVPSELRDRLNAEARRGNTTVAGVIEALIAERERAQRFAAMREAMNDTSRPDAESYGRENSVWGETLTDGMDDART